MRQIIVVLALVGLTSAAAFAQAPSPFVDVPPWHWAFDAVQQGAAEGIFTGYPTNDRDLVANALLQVYAAFAHPGHPAAQEWAEWFLTNTPSGWPQPLQRSRLVRYALENVQVRVSGDRATVTFVAAVTVRTDGGLSPARTPAEAQAEKDGSGRWRIDYATLVSGQPQVFR